MSICRKPYPSDVSTEEWSLVAPYLLLQREDVCTCTRAMRKRCSRSLAGRERTIPWHAAMGATYAHATAPLRRLADRYVVMATLAIANGRDIPEPFSAAFETLPPVMARAGAKQGQIDRAVLGLAETVMLGGDVGKTFPAIVVEADQRHARIQLSDLPVLTRIGAIGLTAGDRIDVRLVAVDRAQRRIDFDLV